MTNLARTEGEAARVGSSHSPGIPHPPRGDRWCSTRSLVETAAMSFRRCTRREALEMVRRVGRASILRGEAHQLRRAKVLGGPHAAVRRSTHPTSTRFVHPCRVNPRRDSGLHDRPVRLGIVEACQPGGGLATRPHFRRHPEQVVPARRGASASQVATGLGSYERSRNRDPYETPSTSGVLVAVHDLGPGLLQDGIEPDPLQHHPAQLGVPLAEDLLRRERFGPEDHFRRNDDPSPE